MKVKDILDEVQKHRQIGDYETIFKHIWDVDADIWDKLISASELNILRPEVYKTVMSDDLEVFADEKYRDMYVYYVLAKDDILFQDTESYSNNMILYNNMMNDFAAEFRETHRSNSKYKIKY